MQLLSGLSLIQVRIITLRRKVLRMKMHSILSVKRVKKVKTKRITKLIRLWRIRMTVFSAYLKKLAIISR
jgi:hypothetical protein